jgi:hypothetical protein
MACKGEIPKLSEQLMLQQEFALNCTGSLIKKLPFLRER